MNKVWFYVLCPFIIQFPGQPPVSNSKRVSPEVFSFTSAKGVVLGLCISDFLTSHTFLTSTRT